MPPLLHVCAHDGCPRLVRGASRCDEHSLERRRNANRSRQSASARGYDRRWAAISQSFLSRHPHCVDCGGNATQSDHAPLTRAQLVAMGVSNPDADEYLVPRCARHHSQKTTRDDGGGWPRRPTLRNATADA